MRLLFLSEWLGPIEEFVKPPARIAFFSIGGEIEADPWWIARERTALEHLGYRVAEMSLSRPRPELVTELIQADAIYMSGGNTFHILKRLRENGLDKRIIDAVNGGKPCIGSGAGAALCGPSIAPTRFFDDAGAVQGAFDPTGLGLVDFVVLPHYGRRELTENFVSAHRDYSVGYRLVPLRDDEAILVTHPRKYEVIRS